MKDLNRWRDVSHLWIKQLNIVKVPVISRSIYWFNAVPIKIPQPLFFKGEWLYLSLFLAAVGHGCCPGAFCIVARGGRSLVVVRGLLAAAASLTLECVHLLWSVSTWAQELWRRRAAASWHVWPSGPGIKLMSPALAGRLLISGPPGKSLFFFFFWVRTRS